MNPFETAVGIVRGKGLRADLVRGGLGSVALKGANAILQLATTVILARSLAADEFGLYAYVLATTSLLAIPAHAGVPTLIVRLTATYKARGEWDLLSGLWLRTRHFIMLVSLVVVVLAIGYFALTDTTPASGGRVLLVTLAAALLIVPIKSVAESRAAALRGLGHIIVGQVPEEFVRPFMFAFLMAIYLLLPSMPFSAPLAMSLHVVAALFAMIFATMMLARFRPVECDAAIPRFQVREWLRSVAPLSMLAGAQVILQQTDSVMLGAIVGVEAVGMYRIVIQGAAFVGFGLLIATTVLSPHIARMHALDDSGVVQSMITESARLVCMAAFLITLIFVVFGKFLIELFFGSHYLPAYIPLLIMCIGLLLKAAAGPAGAVLTMTGHERDAFFGVATATVANVVFNVVLIPPYGIQGAATASAIAFGVWSVQLTRLAHKRTGFDTTILGIWRRGAVDGQST